MERNNMEKEFIPFELSLKMKQLGFNEPCFGYYYTLNGKDWKFAEKSEYYRLDDEINIGGKFSLLAPTYSQAFRWFRENHNLVYQINYLYNGNYQVVIYKNTHEYMKLIQGLEHACVYEIPDNYSYEEAELACLVKLIDIIENK
jgi:hypothetical protein